MQTSCGVNASTSRAYVSAVARRSDGEVGRVMQTEGDAIGGPHAEVLERRRGFEHAIAKLAIRQPFAAPQDSRRVRPDVAEREQLRGNVQRVRIAKPWRKPEVRPRC